MNIVQTTINVLVSLISDKEIFDRIKSDVIRVADAMEGAQGNEKKDTVLKNIDIFLKPDEKPSTFIINVLIELSLVWLRHGL